MAYGNFVQSYTPPSSIDYSITVDNKALINNIIPGGNPGPRNNYAQYPNHTLKQNRNYQVGWVLADKYGRKDQKKDKATRKVLKKHGVI